MTSSLYRTTKSWHLLRDSNTSLTDVEPASRWFVTGLLSAGMLDSSQWVLIHLVIPLWYCSQGNRSKTALRACSSAGLENVSSLRLAFLLSSEDPGPWDPRDPVAVEPSLCPSKFHDLAESDPLETDVAFVSSMVTRAARLLTICSIFVIFASYEATVWESVWTQFSNLDMLSMSSGNFAICTNILWIFSSIVLARYPVPSRSGREPLGEPVFEEEEGNGETGTSVPSLARAMRTGGKQQNWVVDTWTRQKQKRSWTGTTLCTFEQEMALEPKWLRTQHVHLTQILDRNLSHSGLPLL